MGTVHDAGPGSGRHRPRGEARPQRADPRVAALQAQVEQLQHELARLGAEAGQREVLEERVAQLREANQNLVLAAVNAQTGRDDAEAANRRQNEFLAMLAHELRNPLAPIGMAAALLERVPDPPAQLASLAQVIGRQTGHMARLLDDLLDAARISSGKITLAVEPVRLSEAIEQAVETVQPRIKERQQHLVLELPDAPVVVEGDRVRLIQVFTNLLGNASKYTGEHGHLRLAAAQVEDEVVVTIEDNGAGIAAEDLPHIFELFTQGPRSLARSEGGLGIGLNVVRNLVAMHGGLVLAESPGTGAGSRFTVRLPLSLLRFEPRAQGLEPANRAGVRAVLLIEDNVDACTTLQRFLAMEGHHVTVAHDGSTGLALALARQYDAVVCDIGLPGLDGYGVMRALRQAGPDSGPLAIAVSGYCQVEDRARAIAAGFNHYLVKPVRPEALLELIDGAAG